MDLSVTVGHPSIEHFAVDKHILEDSRLSFGALGLLLYVMSREGHYRVDESVLAKERHVDVAVIYSALDELTRLGYAQFRPGKGIDAKPEDGTWAIGGWDPGMAGMKGAR